MWRLLPFTQGTFSFWIVWTRFGECGDCLLPVEGYCLKPEFVLVKKEATRLVVHRIFSFCFGLLCFILWWYFHITRLCLYVYWFFYFIFCMNKPRLYLIMNTELSNSFLKPPLRCYSWNIKFFTSSFDIKIHWLYSSYVNL